MTLTSARHDWEEGQRRFDAEALDATRAGALYAQRDAVVEELRRRVGSTFTLAELAGGSTGSDSGASLELGIGGSRNPGALKCLHAHAAFALACPGYRVGEAVLGEVPERWPERCCSLV